MSSGLDKLLEQLDESLKNKKEVEVYAILFVIFLMIAGLTYTYIFPITESLLEEATKAKNSATKQLAEVENYLESKKQNGDQYYYVKAYEREIELKTIELETIKKDSAYVDKNLKELRHLLYDKENWSKFIDSISMYANFHNLKLNSIDSKVMDISQAQSQLKQVLDIYVKLDGNYQDILKFINDIEQSELVVDLYDITLLTIFYRKEHNQDKYLKISGQYPINATIKISVWGMIYSSEIIKPKVEENPKKNKKAKK